MRTILVYFHSLQSSTFVCERLSIHLENHLIFHFVLSTFIIILPIPLNQVTSVVKFINKGSGRHIVSMYKKYKNLYVRFRTNSLYNTIFCQFINNVDQWHEYKMHLLLVNSHIPTFITFVYKFQAYQNQYCMQAASFQQTNSHFIN